MITLENIIIGSGPAGIQLGYFFKKANIEYLILERSSISASLFDKYPHGSSLISINKKHTGKSKDKEFNLRHDWNSLLNDEDMLFTDYSDDYYPNRKDLVLYMNDFTTKNKLNISYNSNVINISKNTHYGIYILEVEIDSKSVIYGCKKLIIATGLSKMVIPFKANVSRPIKHYGNFEKDFFTNKENLEKYKNKSLLIIGNGNAAFEIGNILTPYCSQILILGRKPKKLAMSSHYAGDLRSAHMSFHDTFLFGSMNAFYNTNDFFSIKSNEEDSSCYNLSFSSGRKEIYDEVIYCSGWEFDNSIFNFNIDISKLCHGKYPSLKSNYESVNNDNLFFIGSLMHSLDYKKSNGGFINGFRYLIKYFTTINYNTGFDINNFTSISELSKHFVNRINTSSSLYQMHGEMCDLFYKEDKECFRYYNDVHNNYINKIKDVSYIFILTLEYGFEKITDIYSFGKKETQLGTENNSSLLHPVITVYKNKDKNPIDIIHFDEDIFTDFEKEDKYENKIERTVRMFS